MSYFKHWWPFCSAEQNSVAKDGRMYYAFWGHFYRLNFGPVVQDGTPFKDISIFSLEQNYFCYFGRGH